ncbi:Holliday junction branch migration protein RuvA [Limosilactobacillus fastidiosus]|uniref:Holliday junction branch migration complex subunit RuvA n=1 Tax=Limosilactobacillus fastidiosus TaxID=2759855 RepID=A0A7W3YBG9_9LACO|nr:Holliday junction branch migration protein RuvA [Limosilactobacillus fastidiosus]MBB1085664.1 Holliday junction branch migration protein RuvA [Limosilactobacillus fastidiosus]MCD7086143.1 Holliday junction branch migration protein RuvA [Limosilactobacillus fastidiosus]MCD7114004.1 Holliday junction branch migration protein RuvA [Limosilactobacillus fastidiosus]MCD7115836.1 Holliday junction branch migration protein RuvA [Limosilactobacillus fastidiosus]
MYEYLTGLVTIVKPRYIVVEVNDIGYQLLVANPYRYHVDKQEKVTVYIYQAVRDDDISLFGFSNEDEKQLFLQLINVSGIGPKSALAILANPDHEGLINAIANDDVKYLTKFPGIGKKTASQICLDLKDKIERLTVSETDLFKPLSTDELATNDALQDALEALTALGYKEREVKRIKKELEKKPVTSTEEYLRHALKLLN